MASKDAKDTAIATATATPDQPPYDLSVDKQMTDTLVFLALLFGIFYFLLIRPQQKQQKSHRDKLSGIKKGSRIITGGGIHGTVTKLEGDDIVHVEIAPNVRIKVHKPTISEVIDDSQAPSSTANDN